VTIMPSLLPASLDLSSLAAMASRVDYARCVGRYVSYAPDGYDLPRKCRIIGHR